MSELAPKHQARGFTLVEAVATMVVLSVIVGLASRVIHAAASSYADGAASGELSGRASSAMERLMGELRGIPSRAGRPGVPWIDSVWATGLTWGGGSSVMLDEGRVRLALDGGPARTLADGVSGFAVACFDANNQPLPVSMTGTACDAVWRIQVTLSLRQGAASETLRTKVYPRCLAARMSP